MVATGRGGHTKTGTDARGSGGCHAQAPRGAAGAACGAPRAAGLSFMPVLLEARPCTGESGARVNRRPASNPGHRRPGRARTPRTLAPGASGCRHRHRKSIRNERVAVVGIGRRHRGAFASDEYSPHPATEHQRFPSGRSRSRRSPRSRSSGTRGRRAGAPPIGQFGEGRTLADPCPAVSCRSTFPLRIRRCAGRDRRPGSNDDLQDLHTLPTRHKNKFDRQLANEIICSCQFRYLADSFTMFPCTCRRPHVLHAMRPAGVGFRCRDTICRVDRT